MLAPLLTVPAPPGKAATNSPSDTLTPAEQTPEAMPGTIHSELTSQALQSPFASFLAVQEGTPMTDRPPLDDEEDRGLIAPLTGPAAEIVDLPLGLQASAAESQDLAREIEGNVSALPSDALLPGSLSSPQTSLIPPLHDAAGIVSGTADQVPALDVAARPTQHSIDGEPLSMSVKGAPILPESQDTPESAPGTSPVAAALAVPVTTAVDKTAAAALDNPTTSAHLQKEVVLEGPPAPPDPGEAVDPPLQVTTPGESAELAGKLLTQVEEVIELQQSETSHPSSHFETPMDPGGMASAQRTLGANSVPNNGSTTVAEASMTLLRLDQLGNHLIMAKQEMKHDAARLEVTLDPPELGRITIELTEVDERVSAKLIVTEYATMEAVKQSLSSMMDSLLDAGVNVNDFQLESSLAEEDTQGGLGDHEMPMTASTEEETHKHPTAANRHGVGAGVNLLI